MVGSIQGESKNHRGGIRNAKDVPTNLLIFDDTLAFGVNLYQIISEHENKYNKCQSKMERFFLSPNYNPRAVCKVNSMVIGRNTFSAFNEIVRECKVVGVEFRAKPSLHSSRGTMISKLQ